MSDRKPNNPWENGDHTKAFETLAAASALGITVATQAMGFWLSVLSGATSAGRSAAEPSQKPDPQPKAAEKPAAAPVSAEVVELKPKPAPKEKKAKPAPKAKPAEVVSKPELAAAPTAEIKAEGASEAIVAEAVAAAPTNKNVEPPKLVELKPEPRLSPEEFRRPVAKDKPAQPDDLKIIKGIGPKLEVTLNGLGVWSLEQVAALEPAEIAWLDDYLGLSGRITRDGWIETARKASRVTNSEETAKAGGDNG